MLQPCPKRALSRKACENAPLCHASGRTSLQLVKYERCGPATAPPPRTII